MFNNAGQHWNHIVFWECMSPTGGKIPSKLEAKINEDLAGVLKDMGDGFSAREALDWSLSISLKALGPDHPTTKSVARNRSLLR